MNDIKLKQIKLAIYLIIILIVFIFASLLSVGAIKIDLGSKSIRYSEEYRELYNSLSKEERKFLDSLSEEELKMLFETPAYIKDDNSGENSEEEEEIIENEESFSGDYISGDSESGDFLSGDK